jgi:hypothetical protein
MYRKNIACLRFGSIKISGIHWEFGDISPVDKRLWSKSEYLKYSGYLGP